MQRLEQPTSASESSEATAIIAPEEPINVSETINSRSPSPQKIIGPKNSTSGQPSQPEFIRLLQSLVGKGISTESEREALALKIQMFKNEKPGFHSPLATEVPKRISNMLAQMSEIYLIVARRNMSEAAIEINPMSLIACDPFETSAMSSSQILLDALPPSFRSECGQSAHACDRDREEHGSKIMDRLECYYARMCATNCFNEPSGSEVISIYPSNR